MDTDKMEELHRVRTQGDREKRELENKLEEEKKRRASLEREILYKEGELAFRLANERMEWRELLAQKEREIDRLLASRLKEKEEFEADYQKKTRELNEEKERWKIEWEKQARELKQWMDELEDRKRSLERESQFLHQRQKEMEQERKVKVEEAVEDIISIERAGWEEKVRVLKEEVRRNQMEARRLRSELIRLENRLKENEEMEEDYRMKIETKEKENRHLRERIEEWEVRLMADEKEKRLLKEELKSLRGLQEALIKAREEVSTWKMMAKQDEKKSKILETELAGRDRDFQDELKNLQRALLQEKRERAHWESEKSLLEEEAERVRGMEEALARERRERRKQEEEARQKGMEIASLQKELKRVENFWKVRVRELEADFRDIQQELRYELDSKKGEAEFLRTNLSRIRSELTGMSQANEEFKRRNARLEQELRQLKISREKRDTGFPDEKKRPAVGIKEEEMEEVYALVAGIAHQLRNPLAIIKTNIQLCLDKYKPRAEIREKLETMLKNIEFAGKRLEEMVYYAHPMVLNFRPFSFWKFLDDILVLVEDRCRKAGLAVEKRYGPDLPNILMDKKSMEKAVLNILLNAIEAMPRGGELILESSQTGENVLLKVTDTGPGMSEETVIMVFDPFFTMKKGSVGLGLNLAKRIIHAHKGEIHLESRKGKGTTVTIRLPVGQGQ